MANYGFNSLTPAQYDDEDRLISWNRDDGNQDQSWNLSLVGDWDSFTEETITETRTHSGVHELESITGGSIPGGLSYDAKGNLTTHSNGHDYTWDFDNKLTLASVSSGEPGIVGTHSYTYDALGRRVSKTVGSNTTVFFCSGQQVLAEYVGSTAAISPSQQYVYGSYIDEPILMDAGGTQYYYHCNHLYSIAALTDSVGNVVERYTYDSYGRPVILDASATSILAASSLGNPYLFTGRRFDAESTLYFYRARFFDPKLGRFVSRDPIGYWNVANLYTYVRSSPQMYLDPSGLIERPSFGVSLIPVFGSGYEAAYHFQQGNYMAGAFYTGLAVTDVFLVKSVVTGVGKVGLRAITTPGFITVSSGTYGRSFHMAWRSGMTWYHGMGTKIQAMRAAVVGSTWIPTRNWLVPVLSTAMTEISKERTRTLWHCVVSSLRAVNRGNFGLPVIVPGRYAGRWLPDNPAPPIKQKPSPRKNCPIRTYRVSPRAGVALIPVAGWLAGMLENSHPIISQLPAYNVADRCWKVQHCGSKIIWKKEITCR